jgi:hypothetical protein
MPCRNGHAHQVVPYRRLCGMREREEGHTAGGSGRHVAGFSSASGSARESRRCIGGNNGATTAGSSSVEVVRHAPIDRLG